MSKANAILQLQVKEKMRTSFSLAIDKYKEFKKVCDSLGITTSEALDALIEDFVDLARSTDK